MDSFEFILYALVGLSLVIRPFLKKGKESRGLFETEDVPEPEVSPVPTTSWEDLMKELKKVTEQQMNKPEERVEERVEPIGIVESQSASAQVSVETSQTNISKDIKEKKKKTDTIEKQTEKDGFDCDFTDVDELKRAVIYTEILNRKEY